MSVPVCIRQLWKLYPKVATAAHPFLRWISTSGQGDPNPTGKYPYIFLI